MIQEYEMTTASSLAARLVSLSGDDLTQAATHSVARCVLDILAAAAAGCSTAVVNSVVARGAAWARTTFCEGDASHWFDGTRRSVAGAAFVNSLAASVLDVDDGHRMASGHPGAAVIPAVLAAAEADGAAWPDVLLAIVCGYEAGVRVAAARKPLRVSVATGRWAAVAVAAAVGKLRRFSEEALTNAIALAEAHAPNMAAADHAGFAGGHAKEGIPWSVVTGLAAAEQAALGLKGYIGALDNRDIYEPGRILPGTERALLIETTYVKPYACCRWTHSAIDAVLDMRKCGLDPAAVELIEVATFQRAISLDNLIRPSDIIAAQFSIPFVVAVALIEGADALLPMSTDLLRRADVIEMAGRVVLVSDPKLEACFPGKVPARLKVRARGEVVEREVHTPLGDFANPLSDRDLTNKAIRLCAQLKDEDEVRQFANDLLCSANSVSTLPNPIWKFIHQVP